MCTLCLGLRAQTDSTIVRGTTANRPFALSPYSPWSLHEGLNIDVGLSAFASFGKYGSGAGFSQQLSATYLTPLNDRLWLAAGGYGANTSWHGGSWRSAGIYAMLGYRFDEHWEATLYAEKTLVGNNVRYRYRLYPTVAGYGVGSPFLPYSYTAPDERIGASLTYHFTPAFSMSLSVEKGWYDNGHDFALPDRHDNPPQRQVP